MKYYSVDGCLFYYDRTLYRWQVAEPTMLFLLGIESILSYDLSVSDKLTISKYIYKSFSDETIPLHNFTYLDQIYRFLSSSSSIEDYETYLRYDCHGLKLLLNELTGTDNKRTVPLIFKNSINAKMIDYNAPMYRADSNLSDMNISDLHAQKIIDIFTDAAFKQSTLIITDTLIAHALDDTKQFNDEIASKAVDDINKYIADVDGILDERNNNRSLFKYIDYKAMYAYAFGVLCGCNLLGYSFTNAFYADPKYWYRGGLTNLVSTAWYVFNFHYRNNITDADDVIKYTSIQPNKILNFTNNNGEKQFILSDEKLRTFAGRADNGTLFELHGSFSRDSSLDDYFAHLDPPQPPSRSGYFTNTNASTWLHLDNSINTVSAGIYDQSATPIIRYFYNVPFEIHYANDLRLDDDSYAATDRTASPTFNEIKCNAYTSLGNLGWFNFHPDSHGLSHSLFKSSYITDDTDVIYVKDKSTKQISASLKGNIDIYDRPYANIYGIIDVSNTDGQVKDNFIFSNILYQSQFSNQYDEINIPSPELKKLKPFYYGPTKVGLFYDDTSELYYNDSTGISLDGVLNEGYSTTPSTLITTYYDEFVGDVNVIRHQDVMYNDSLHKYYIDDGWYSFDEVHPPRYVLVSRTAKLYRGESLLAGINKLYAEHSTENYYVHYVGEINPIQSFTSINYLYANYGLTLNRPCTIITHDDYGNELVDEDGNYVVWYDSETSLYWNGLNHINKWVADKPTYMNATLYNAADNTLTNIKDNLESEFIITEDGSIVQYRDIYHFNRYTFNLTPKTIEYIGDFKYIELNIDDTVAPDYVYTLDSRVTFKSGSNVVEIPIYSMSFGYDRELMVGRTPIQLNPDLAGTHVYVVVKSSDIADSVLKSITDVTVSTPIESFKLRVYQLVNSSASVNIRDVPILSRSTVVGVLDNTSDKIYGSPDEIYPDPERSYQWQRFYRQDGTIAYIDASNTRLTYTVIDVSTSVVPISDI